MSKSQIGKWCLAIALLLAIAAEVADFVISPSEKKSLATAQQQLNKLEERIKGSLSTISEFQSVGQFHEFFIHHGAENRGFSFFYFINDTLLYWSDSKIALSPA